MKTHKITACDNLLLQFRNSKNRYENQVTRTGTQFKPADVRIPHVTQPLATLPITHQGRLWPTQGLI